MRPDIKKSACEVINALQEKMVDEVISNYEAFTKAVELEEKETYSSLFRWYLENFDLLCSIEKKLDCHKK